MSEQGTTLAASLMNAGLVALRTSVTGAPRGPFCGMGICFECRHSEDEPDDARTCMVVRPRDPVLAGERVVECDVAVIGAGPAGLAAAARAAERGKRVVMLDASPSPGGQIWRQGIAASAPSEARAWLSRIAHAKVQVIDGAEVIDVPTARTLTVHASGIAPQRERERADRGGRRLLGDDRESRAVLREVRGNGEE